jgi:hypothetical protein
VVILQDDPISVIGDDPQNDPGDVNQSHSAP